MVQRSRQDPAADPTLQSTLSPSPLTVVLCWGHVPAPNNIIIHDGTATMALIVACAGANIVEGALAPDGTGVTFDSSCGATAPRIGDAQSRSGCPPAPLPNLFISSSELWSCNLSAKSHSATQAAGNTDLPSAFLASSNHEPRRWSYFIMSYTHPLILILRGGETIFRDAQYAAENRNTVRTSRPITYSKGTMQPSSNSFRFIYLIILTRVYRKCSRDCLKMEDQIPILSIFSVWCWKDRSLIEAPRRVVFNTGKATRE